MKAKYYYIVFILILAQNILAQTTVVIQDGTGIYVPLGASFCADTIIVLEGGYYITDDTSGTCPGATITGGGYISLPVELTSFTASISSGTVTLNWTTSTETNNSGFEVQRKLENSDWERTDFVDGHGTTTETQNYQYIDELSGIQAASLSYRLKQIDYDGSYEYSEVVEVTNPAPTEFALQQNYPNPFNPTTTIGYSLPIKARVELVVYNTLGESLMQLVNEEKEAGRYEIKFNSHSGTVRNLPSGIYFYRLQVYFANGGAGSFVETKKMILIK